MLVTRSVLVIEVYESNFSTDSDLFEHKMSVQSQDALKSIGQGFKESKRKQLLSFLEDQKQLTIRLRKCSFDTTKPGSSDVGRTHRLRPLSARPKTAETSEPYSESSYNNESRRRPVSKLVRRPSTACGLHPSEENDYSDEESEFDALSITSIQSGTPSIGDLGNIDELDEDEEDISVANMKLQRQRPSAIDLTMKDATYSSDNSSNFSAKFRNVSSVYISDKRFPSGKPGSKSRRKSASSLKHSQFSVGATSSIVEPGSITSVTTIECSASLYKKIRHHSAPATRNDEIIARMGQASKRPVGLFRLPPLASERALPGANCSEHSSPSPESNFIRTQSLLETEPIL